ncbi:MAG TPA: hypothetical protein GXZ82_00235 [Firmicutes bacterium]|jgi:hypothetical protein|nr:hypothetical protein [Bacillota bacterium]
MKLELSMCSPGVPVWLSISRAGNLPTVASDATVHEGSWSDALAMLQNMGAQKQERVKVEENNVWIPFHTAPKREPALLSISSVQKQGACLEACRVT